MRFYDIKLFDSITKQPLKDAQGNIRQWTSKGKNGLTISGALNIEIDAPVSPMHIANGSALLKIWGISVQDIGSASDFNGQIIEISAGMQKGLPLANPAQSGVILRGTIFQAFGNWQGTNMTIDFVIIGDTGSNDNQKNITFNWLKGQKMSDAIAITLKDAFPTYNVPRINISSDLVAVNDSSPGYYPSLEQFARYINQTSLSIIKTAQYGGVLIYRANNTFDVVDSSSNTTPKAIVPTDFIGQPTWIEAQVIQIKCVMRADISVNDVLILPQFIGVNQKASQAFVRNKISFSGKWQVQELRHIGNFRQQDANSWVTVINLSPIPQ